MVVCGFCGLSGGSIRVRSMKCPRFLHTPSPFSPSPVRSAFIIRSPLLAGGWCTSFRAFWGRRGIRSFFVSKVRLSSCVKHPCNFTTFISLSNRSSGPLVCRSSGCLDKKTGAGFRRPLPLLHFGFPEIDGGAEPQQIVSKIARIPIRIALLKTRRGPVCAGPLLTSVFSRSRPWCGTTPCCRCQMHH